MRKLFYETSAIDTLKTLQMQGFTQHIEKIRTEAILIRTHGETLATLQPTDAEKPLYVQEIEGLPIKGSKRTVGYLLWVLLEEQSVRVLEITPYARFFP